MKTSSWLRALGRKLYINSPDGPKARFNLKSNEKIAKGFKRTSMTGFSDYDYSPSPFGAIIRHSDKPNTTLRVGKDGDLHYYTTGPVRAGEPLTFNFNSLSPLSHYKHKYKERNTNPNIFGEYDSSNEIPKRENRFSGTNWGQTH